MSHPRPHFRPHRRADAAEEEAPERTPFRARRGSGGRSGGDRRRDSRGDDDSTPINPAGLRYARGPPRGSPAVGTTPTTPDPTHSARRSPAAGASASSKKKSYFPAHLSADEAIAGLSEGRYLLGFLRINAKRFVDAYVPVEGIPVDIYVEGDINRSRALDGDIVVIQLEAEDGWEGKKGTKRLITDEEGEVLEATPLKSPAGPVAAADVHALAHKLGTLSVDPDEAPAFTDADAATLTQNLWQPIYSFKASEKGALNVPSVPAMRETAAAAVTDVNGKQLPPRLSAAISTPAYKKLVADVAKATQGGTVQPRASVVHIAVRIHSREVIGVLKSADMNAPENAPIPPHMEFVRLAPTDKRIPFVIIPRAEVSEPRFFEAPGEFSTKLFGASIVNWSAGSRFPLGALRQSLGEAGEISAETRALLEANGISDAPFSAAVIESLAPFSAAVVESGAPFQPTDNVWRIPESEFAKRRDYRAHRIMTIDPTTAKDLDDAVHIIPLGDDIYELGVHIADVSYFIPPGSALDYEARSRCTSVYLVQRVIPMLPPLLCEQLCSLNPGVDRLAFSCVWKMKGNGELLPEAPWFGRSIIRSVAKLDYTTAQRLIDKEITDDMLRESGDIPVELWDPARRPGAAAAAAGSATLLDASGKPVHHSCADVAADVRLMHKIAMARRRKRFEAGALALNKTKLVMKLDAEGNPVGVTTYPIRDSNKMIEEYMLLANYLVAQQLIHAVEKRAVLRCHPPIMEDRSDRVKAIAKELGLPLDLSSASRIHNSLLAIYSADKEAGRVIEYLATKQMKPAQYFAAGAQDPSTWPHYALAIPYYTHFTSPIRRYADVMVHRLLAESLGEPVVGKVETAEQLNAQCDKCNDKKKGSKDAQERSDIVYLTVYLRDHPVETEAIVCDISGEKFMTIVVPMFDIERKVYFDKSGWRAMYDDKSHSVALSRDTKTAAAGGGARTPVPGEMEMPSKRSMKDIVRWCVAHPFEAKRDYGVMPLEAGAGHDAYAHVEAQVVGLFAIGDTRLAGMLHKAESGAVDSGPKIAAAEDTIIFPSDFAKAGKPKPVGWTDTNFNDKTDSIKLRHMSKLRVRLRGVTTKVPIDIEVDVLEVLRLDPPVYHLADSTHV